MAANRGHGKASTKTSGDVQKRGEEQEPTPDASSGSQEGTSSGSNVLLVSAPPVTRPVGSVSPVVRQEVQVGRLRGCFRGGTMTFFQVVAAPEPAAGVLGAKEIPSPGPGSSSKDVKRSQDDKNPPQGQLTGTSGTPVASQVGQRGSQVY